MIVHVLRYIVQIFSYDSSLAASFSLILFSCRHLGESVSLGSLLYLLFRSLVARNCSSLHDRSDPSLSYSISLINTRWEYLFAVQLLEKYSCTIWLPSILMLLQRIVVNDSDAAHFMELLVAVYFISNKLQNPEIAFKLDSGEDSDNIQVCIFCNFFCPTVQ